MPIPQDEESRTFQQLLARIAVDAAMALFMAYDVVLSLTDPVTGRANGPMQSVASIKFGGPFVTGTIVIGATADPLRHSNQVATSDQDWICELANQLFGRIKTKMSRLGLPLTVDHPSAIVDNADREFGDSGARPIFLTSMSGGIVGVVADVRVTPGFRPVGPVPPGEILSEGDVLIF